MNRKQQHVYRLSYAHDVGSSFDPDVENIADWERELRGTGPQSLVYSRL